MELTICDLTKEFGSFRAVDRVSFTMTNGVYGLLGVNGAGKTTLMRMLTTLIKPTDGEILWDGQDVFKMDGQYRKLLGYLPQDFGYYPDFSIYDYLMYIASIKGIRPAAAKERVKLLLKQVGLFRARHKKMKNLSGGMKRRVALARALFFDGDVVLLDECFTGLDDETKKVVASVINRETENKTLILISHDSEDAELLNCTSMILKNGFIK